MIPLLDDADLLPGAKALVTCQLDGLAAEGSIAGSEGPM